MNELSKTDKNAELEKAFNEQLPFLDNLLSGTIENMIGIGIDEKTATSYAVNVLVFAAARQAHSLSIGLDEEPNAAQFAKVCNTAFIQAGIPFGYFGDENIQGVTT